MWRFSAAFVIAFSQMFVSPLAGLAIAGLPTSELSIAFRGPSGNTGGVDTLGASFRAGAFEASMISFNDEWSLIAGARGDLNPDGIFVPHLLLGLQLIPDGAFVPGVGLEILAPPVSLIFERARFGIRMDTLALIQFSQIRDIVPLLTLGAVCHF